MRSPSLLQPSALENKHLTQIYSHPASLGGWGLRTICQDLSPEAQPLYKSDLFTELLVLSYRHTLN